jgi:hypothetical protein
MSALTFHRLREPNRWMVLLACIVAVLMVAIDAGILNLVVPAI